MIGGRRRVAWLNGKTSEWNLKEFKLNVCQYHFFSQFLSRPFKFYFFFEFERKLWNSRQKGSSIMIRKFSAGIRCRKAECPSHSHPLSIHLSIHEELRFSQIKSQFQSKIFRIYGEKWPFFRRLAVASYRRALLLHWTFPRRDEFW